MFGGGGDKEEAVFRAIKLYLSSSCKDKREFILDKIRRDSIKIQSTYYSLQDILPKLEQQKLIVEHPHLEQKRTHVNPAFSEKDHLQHLVRISDIYKQQWQDLVDERRANETTFGDLWKQVCPYVCGVHSESMYFFWDTPNTTLTCVGCDRVQMEATWAAQEAERDGERIAWLASQSGSLQKDS
jgi:hypothetical protein